MRGIIIAMEKGAMVAGGRGGSGNIVRKDRVAPPPAPMEPSLEVETARDRLTTHGRGGEGNWYWHVLEEGKFKTVIEYEQRMVLLNRVREDGSPKSTTDSPLDVDEGDRMDSPTTPVSDEPFLCHTEIPSEDASMPSGRLSKLSLREPLKRVLWSPTKRWRHRSSSSCSDNSALSLSTAATSADLHFPPVTPIDGPASPVSVALHKDALLDLDISSPGLQYPLSSK